MGRLERMLTEGESEGILKDYEVSARLGKTYVIHI